MKQKRISLRIQIEPEKLQFIEDYNLESGLDKQKFIMQAVDEKIASIQFHKHEEFFVKACSEGTLEVNSIEILIAGKGYHRENEI